VESSHSGEDAVVAKADDGVVDDVTVAKSDDGVVEYVNDDAQSDILKVIMPKFEGFDVAP
jgi:hypothetical protein